jgi:RimJ/RimL family protein N-acetyltransferase
VLLGTRRLRLVPFAPAHADALHALWTDPQVRLYLWDGKILPRERVLQAIADSEQSFARLGFGQFALFTPGEAEPIGFCGLRRFEGGDQPELLYGILPALWGEGLVTEAAGAVLADAFDRLGVDRVVAATDTPNQNAVRVLQRLGMSFDGRRLHHGLDTVFYSLSRSDFMALRAEAAD